MPPVPPPPTPLTSARSTAARTARAAVPVLVVTLLACLACLAAFAAFAAFAVLVLGRETGFIDEPVLNGAVEHRAAALDGPMEAVTYSSKYPLLFVTAVGAALVARRDRSWRPLLLVGGTGALSVAVATLAKETTDRHRPPSALQAIPEEGFCFPSRHTVIATAVLLILAYVAGERLASRLLRATLWCAALAGSALVGASRVYLGVHWATDVLAGLALGAAVALAVRAADGVAARRRLP